MSARITPRWRAACLFSLSKEPRRRKRRWARVFIDEGLCHERVISPLIRHDKLDRSVRLRDSQGFHWMRAPGAGSLWAEGRAKSHQLYARWVYRSSGLTSPRVPRDAFTRANPHDLAARLNRSATKRCGRTRFSEACAHLSPQISGRAISQDVSCSRAWGVLFLSFKPVRKAPRSLLQARPHTQFAFPPRLPANVPPSFVSAHRRISPLLRSCP